VGGTVKGKKAMHRIKTTILTTEGDRKFSEHT
jgi:hypothetical protein